jgi:hypothetical protein
MIQMMGKGSGSWMYAEAEQARETGTWPKLIDVRYL